MADWGRTAALCLRVLAGLALVGAAAATASAQEESIDQRLQRIAGISPAAARDAFMALRRGLANGNKAEVCGLVTYPLKQPKGDVASAAQCEARYDEIFTIPVRRAVGKALFEELCVAPSAVVVNFGEVWFAKCQGSGCAPGSLRITQVNHADDGSLRPPEGKLLLSCVLVGPGEGQWLRLISDGQGRADFGLWPPAAYPNAASMPPVVKAKSAPPAPPRTPDCAFRTWSFPGAPVSYEVVSTLSCISDKEDVIPPMGAVGQLTRVSAAKGTETVWCIE